MVRMVRALVYGTVYPRFDALMGTASTSGSYPRPSDRESASQGRGAEVRLRMRASDFAMALRLAKAGRDEAKRLEATCREELRPGDPVDIEVSFGPFADEVVVHGLVVDIRETSSRHRLATIALRTSETERLDYIAQVLAGQRRATARRDRRVRVDLDASWKSRGQLHAARLLDISRRGAFVRSSSPPQVGTTVDLELRLDDEAMRFEAEVTWIRGGHEGGFGVSFRLPDRDAAARMSELVRSLESPQV